MTRSASKGSYVPLNPIALTSRFSAPNRSSPSAVTSTVVGSNADLLREVAKLWITPHDVVVDATYGRGVFWQQLPELPTHAYDLKTGHDLRDLPLADESVDVLVLDPPYRPTHGSPDFDRHRIASGYGNGTTALNTMNDVLDLYRAGIREGYRVLKTGGRLLVKCQDMAYNHRLHLVTLDVMQSIISAGLDLADQFILASPAGISGSPGIKSSVWTGQERARRAHSVLWVAVKLGSRQPCVREGGTPDGDRLIVDCSVHGEIGSIPAQWVKIGDGLTEYDRMEALFADHVRSAGAGPIEQGS